MSVNYSVKAVGNDPQLRAKVQVVFMESFPIYERVPLTPFFDKHLKGLEIYALEDEAGNVVAFFCTLEKENIFYIFYLAVSKSTEAWGLAPTLLT